ncbi:MAG: 50S ribosomal protein L29 [Candidatus Cloacimonetes bacterium HGW-Cloacimonetes-1]|jgi:large subunit ribosomal protein L29|nr:MAG: 50S ribosomal protein L29 [Candidatus Cloacimonetes bacterium HGW-Cloacimonetes-1]
MKTEELRELSITELNAKMEQLRIEMFNLRFQKAKNLLDRTDRVRFVRRDIARILTIIKQLDNSK